MKVGAEIPKDVYYEEACKHLYYKLRDNAETVSQMKLYDVDYAAYCHVRSRLQVPPCSDYNLLEEDDMFEDIFIVVRYYLDVLLRISDNRNCFVENETFIIQNLLCQSLPVCCWFLSLCDAASLRKWILEQSNQESRVSITNVIYHAISRVPEVEFAAFRDTYHSLLRTLELYKNNAFEYWDLYFYINPSSIEGAYSQVLDFSSVWGNFDCYVASISFNSPADTIEWTKFISTGIHKTEYQDIYKWYTLLARYLSMEDTLQRKRIDSIMTELAKTFSTFQRYPKYSSRLVNIILKLAATNRLCQEWLENNPSTFSMYNLYRQTHPLI